MGAHGSACQKDPLVDGTAESKLVFLLAQGVSPPPHRRHRHKFSPSWHRFHSAQWHNPTRSTGRRIDVRVVPTTDKPAGKQGSSRHGTTAGLNRQSLQTRPQKGSSRNHLAPLNRRMSIVATAKRQRRGCDNNNTTRTSGGREPCENDVTQYDSEHGNARISHICDLLRSRYLPRAEATFRNSLQ